MSQASPFAAPDAAQIAIDIERALAEDLGQGDATAGLLPIDARAHAELTCRDAAVIAGTAWFDACFRRLDPAVQIDWQVHDGDRVDPGSVICRLSGYARPLVTAERSALNFLQLLSATATATADYVAAVAGTAVRVLDTRKTIPGLRLAQKYAVRCGGGHNQRMGLYDAILVKENHIIAAGSIGAAVHAARRLHPDLLLEVEVENLDELRTGAGKPAWTGSCWTISSWRRCARQCGTPPAACRWRSPATSICARSASTRAPASTSSRSAR